MTLCFSFTQLIISAVPNRRYYHLTAEARIALLTLFEDRYEKKSVIITSQLPLERWYDYIAEPTLADAIMDRLVNSSEHIELKGETLRHKRRDK
ncbi:MAG: ATP-binding protein [Bacteroidales bacterium]|nr:ATP-binding protein [Bacteroidales bacterium]